MGGLLVEVGNDRFHVFEITAQSDGSFHHLTNYYSGDSVTECSGVAGVYMGDEHEESYDASVRHATYTGSDSIVVVLQPETVIRGDVYNHGSDSHHERKNVLNRIMRADNDRNNVQEELDSCFHHIRDTTVGGYKNIIVASNHHDHLARWANEFNPHTGDARNVLVYHKINVLMIEEALSGGSNTDPFMLYCREYHEDVYNNCIFLDRDEEFKVAGVSVDLHGDKGPNGARGSATNLSSGGQPIVIGHSHTPRIYRNVYQVGTGAEELGYNKGYSGWLATHCCIYPDGNRTMIHIINGEWRL
jgi:hypothetical protein